MESIIIIIKSFVNHIADNKVAYVLSGVNALIYI